MLQCVPAEQRALDAAGVAAHACQADELAQVGSIGFALSGEHRAKVLLQVLRSVHFAPLDRLAHHGGRGHADGTPLAAETNVPHLVVLNVQLHSQVVATLWIGAARAVAGVCQVAKIARGALVLHDQFLVQVVFSTARAGVQVRGHRNTSTARATPAIRRSTSLWVL